jgi:Zn-dependent metalloprotease
MINRKVTAQSGHLFDSEECLYLQRGSHIIKLDKFSRNLEVLGGLIMCFSHTQGVVNPVLCILPPHMLQAIAENGTNEQKEVAIDTLRATAQFRGERRFEPLVRSLEGTVSREGMLRRIYDAQNGTSLPGVLVRSEADPAHSDVAVNEAYDGAGNTYLLFKDVYGRDSIDGAGMDIESVVHFSTSYDNAYWNGRYMVYGDGDEDLPVEQRLFNRFTIAMDVIGHELTHGVTSYTANLYYYEQSGALNESFSDVFGILTKQRFLGQTAAESDWVIGAGLFTPRVQGVGIRSMSNPGTAYNDPVLGRDPQPGHMNNYVNTTQDNGGVHINSGIPNRAFTSQHWKWVEMPGKKPGGSGTLH